MRNYFLTLCLLFVFTLANAQDEYLWSVDKLASVMEKKPMNVVLVDVRTPEEYGDGTIEGALNVDVKSDNFADSIATLDKKKVYVVYCKAGPRSERARDAMKEAGFKYVWLLDGGFTAWKDEEQPVYIPEN